jgi:hypothetical protein
MPARHQSHHQDRYIRPSQHEGGGGGLLGAIIVIAVLIMAVVTIANYLN